MGRWKNQFKLNGLYQRKVQVWRFRSEIWKRKGSKQPHVTGLPILKKFGKKVKIQICWFNSLKTDRNVFSVESSAEIS